MSLLHVNVDCAMRMHCSKLKSSSSCHRVILVVFESQVFKSSSHDTCPTLLDHAYSAECDNIFHLLVWPLGSLRHSTATRCKDCHSKYCI